MEILRTAHKLSLRKLRLMVPVLTTTLSIIVQAGNAIVEFTWGAYIAGFLVVILSSPKKLLLWRFLF